MSFYKEGGKQTQDEKKIEIICERRKNKEIMKKKKEKKELEKN